MTKCAVETDIETVCTADHIPAPEQFRHWVSAALTASGTDMAQTHIGLRLVDKAESAGLNFNWRQRQGATNVLSFPFEMPPGVPADAVTGLLGDLVICVPLVEEEARQQGKRTVAHWAHLTVHGTLHLLGYDHTEDSQALVMENLESGILTGLGYPDPYQAVTQENTVNPQA